MTSAHRPTWNPATGGKDQGGNRILVPSRQYSSKDLPGHTVIKYRKSGQGTAEEMSRVDFKQDLLTRESKQKSLKSPKNSPSPSNSEISESDAEKDPVSDSASENDSSSDFSEEELLQEIEKIKAERAEAERLRRSKEEAETKSDLKKKILEGNPLLDVAPGFSLKRKWTEETIFRNQSRDEPKDKQRFVNDTVRSDFHRKILRKFIV